MQKYSLYHLFFGSLVILVVLLFLLIFLSINLQRNELLKTATEEKIRLAEIINEAIFSPALIYRAARIPGTEQILLSEMAKFRDVLFLRVVGVKGNVLLSTIEGEWGKTFEEPDIVKALTLGQAAIKDEDYQGEKIKLIIYPGYGDRTIWLGFSLKSVDLLVKKTMIRSLGIGLGALLFVTLFLFLLLRSLIDPLRKMTLACQEIRKGNLDVQVGVKSKTEIGELTDTFNEMIKDLRQSHAALEEAKTVLEIKVEARTKELRELAEGLEEEVKRRTKEIQEKMVELEKFQKLAVGRELKMIELKKKIEELEKENQKLKTKQGLKI